MSKGPVKVSAEEAAKNQAFLASMAASGKERYIKRHSLQARLTHGITIAACILLCISGLFVFVPALAAAVGADTVFAIRMSHRIIGVVFVAVPLISALLAPKGVAHIFKNLFDRWDSDDKKWMMLFFPYLFMAKWIHMPDQREVKSGQRFADGMLWFAGALMGITGIILLLGTTLFDFGAGVHGVTLFLHDIGFLLIAVFGLAHIFLGAGIFQPYRGTAKLMFGDGTVSESDALYHWGHWARKEIATGENVVEKAKSAATFVPPRIAAGTERRVGSRQTLPEFVILSGARARVEDHAYDARSWKPAAAIAARDPSTPACAQDDKKGVPPVQIGKESMNLKAIDAAIAAYRTNLDESDVSRLAFFRELWGVQAEAASHVDLGYEVPDADSLKTWARHGEPVLSHAPVKIEAAALAGAMERLAEVLAARGGFAASTSEALSRTSWERMVAASDLALAGCNPAAYVESFVELLEDDGMDEDAARIGAMAAALALRAFLEGPATAVERARREAGADEPHSVRCPVCGGEAAVAQVSGAPAGQGRAKRLWCAQCGCAWGSSACVACAAAHGTRAIYIGFNLEATGAPPGRHCDECGGYARTVPREDAHAVSHSKWGRGRGEARPRSVPARGRRCRRKPER